MADITINPGINSVDYANGYALINTNQCYFIDVREIDEYQSGFIPSHYLLQNRKTFA